MQESFKIPSATFPTITGSIVTFNSQYAGLPLKSHKVNIDSVSGVSAISIAHSNRNILPYTLEDIIDANGGQATWTDNQKTINGMTFTLNTDSNGKLTSITVNGTTTYNTAFYLHSRFTSIYFPDSTLYSGVSSNVAGYSARISHSGGQIIASTTAAVAKKTYSNCDIILFFNSGNTFDITVSSRLILSGESDNSYVPHEGTYTTINIGQTVKAGIYNARTGLLLGDYDYIDLGSLTWGYTASGNRFTSSGIASVIKKPTTDSDTADVNCSIYTTMPLTGLRSSSSDNLIAVGDSGTISIRNTTYGTDANAFKTAMSGVYLKYAVASPTSLQLEPCPIDVLAGVNNIWADTGDTTLQYPKFG